MFGLLPHAKFVSRPYFAFCGTFPVESGRIKLFYFLFSCINLLGIVPGLTQGVEKGRGRLTLCGPNGHMWTRMGKMMNVVKMSGKG